MGILINNSQRKSDFQLISDLLNQIQNTLSDPNITDDAKQQAKLVLSELSTNISQQNMRKSVAREYTIQQLEHALNTLETGRGKYQPLYNDTARTMRQMVLFNPTAPVDPVTLDGGTNPDKQKRVKRFAYNLWNLLTDYKKYLSNDDYAIEGWNAENTDKVKKWLLDLAVLNNMDDDTLNKKIAIMGNIVDSLENEALIDAHFQYFSPFDTNNMTEEADAAEESLKKTWVYDNNTYTEADYLGPISDYLISRGYEIGELDDKYYVFKNRLPATTNGWYAVLDPTSDAYQTVYNFASNGLLDYDSYENVITKLNLELRDLLYNRIRDEHNEKFPVEYYSLLGNFDIIDLSNYMTDSDPSNREVIYYKVPSSYLHGLWIDWDEIFRNRPDWKSKFKYDGDADYDVHTNSSPTNQYANAHGYVANAEFPTLIATDEELNTFLNQVIYDDGLFGSNPQQSISDVLNEPNVDRRSPEDQLANIVRLILKGESGQEELNNSHRPIINTIDIDDIPNTIFTADEKAAYKTRYGHPVRYDYVLKHMLHKNSNMYKRILKRIMLTADNKTDRQNAYNELIRIKNDNPLAYAKGGILKMKTGGDTLPTGAMYNSEIFTPQTIIMGAPSITNMPTTYIGDPDASDGRVYESFKDVLSDPDVRNPLILHGLEFLADVAAAGVSNVPGYGTAAAGGLGLLSTGIGAAADYIDPYVSKEEAWRNAGTNLALTAVGMIPDAKFFTTGAKGLKIVGSVLGKAIKAGFTLLAIAGSLGLAVQDVQRLVEWMNTAPEDRKWTAEDVMLLSHTVNTLLRGIGTGRSKRAMKRTLKQVIDPNYREVTFSGDDGLSIKVRMTKDLYEKYTKSKSNNDALTFAKTIAGPEVENKLQSNNIDFDGNWLKKWYNTPNYEPAKIYTDPKGYLKMLLHPSGEPVLGASFKSEITNVEDMPASVSYVTGHGLPSRKNSSEQTPKNHDIVIENGKLVEYQNSMAAKNQNSPIFKGIDFSKPTELLKYPNRQNLPKGPKSVPAEEVKSAEDITELLKKYNYTLGTSEKVRGGVIFDNKLYWWKSGGKLDRLNNYLSNK